MSPLFESFLARLYVDADLRAAFLADVDRVATAAGLAAEEIAALRAIDREGLELAAASFAHKRAATSLRRRAVRRGARARLGRGPLARNWLLLGSALAAATSLIFLVARLR